MLSDTGTYRKCGPALGESQEQILDRMKRKGPLSIPEISGALGLSVETVRAHLRILTAKGLVRRAGTRSRGSGRPGHLFNLTEAARTFFPDRQGEVLLSLVRYLGERGGAPLLHQFFRQEVEDRREEAMARVEGLQGKDRVREVARILTEWGFMAEVENEPAGPVRLRLCHCPVKGLVDLTQEPCGAELSLVRDLLDADLTRVSHIPSGDSACVYDIREPYSE